MKTARLPSGEVTALLAPAPRPPPRRLCRRPASVALRRAASTAHAVPSTSHDQRFASTSNDTDLPSAESSMVWNGSFFGSNVPPAAARERGRELLVIERRRPRLLHRIHEDELDAVRRRAAIREPIVGQPGRRHAAADDERIDARRPGTSRPARSRRRSPAPRRAGPEPGSELRRPRPPNRTNEVRRRRRRSRENIGKAPQGWMAGWAGGRRGDVSRVRSAFWMSPHESLR